MTLLRIPNAILAVSFTAILGACAPTAAAADPACAIHAREAAFAAAAEAVAAGAPAQQASGFLHPRAVFGVGTPSPLVGRDAVLAAWPGLQPGSALRWRPAFVTIDPVHGAAVSTGPYWMAVAGEPGLHAFGRFQSFWVRGEGGDWQVLFDGGEAPRRGDATALEAFLASFPAGCGD